jgi:glutathione S-transferase
MPTLYVDRFWISPYAFSAFVALTEKGVKFEAREIALDQHGQNDPRFRDASLTARVPALDDDGFWLAESSAIAEYVDERWPEDGPRIMPENVRDRARARQVMAWIRSDLMPIREERATHTMFYERAKVPLTEAGQKAAEKLERVAMELVPDGRKTLAPAFSVADADLGFMLQRLLMNGHELPQKLRAYADAQWSRPSVRAFVERKRPPYVAY